MTDESISSSNESEDDIPLIELKARLMNAQFQSGQAQVDKTSQNEHTHQSDSETAVIDS